MENDIIKLGKDLQQSEEKLSRKVLNILEIELDRSKRKTFQQEGRPAWKPSQKKKNRAGSKTLTESGHLATPVSVTNFADRTVTQSVHPSARAYAEIHEKGGTINRKPQSLKFRSKGGRKVFAKKTRKTGVTEKTTKAYTIVIPARPHMGIRPEDIPVIERSISQIKLM